MECTIRGTMCGLMLILEDPLRSFYVGTLRCNNVVCYCVDDPLCQKSMFSVHDLLVQTRPFVIFLFESTLPVFNRTCMHGLYDYRMT